MERYIGLDVHQASTTMAVVGPSGKVLRTEVIETSAAALISALKSVQGVRHVCFEECTQSVWLYEVLVSHVEELVVCGVGESRGPKSDAIDAVRLAQDLRTGQILQKVFKEQGAYLTLRELSHAHLMVVSDVVRAKNRLKNLYRSRGIQVAGKSVYSLTARREYIERLPRQMLAAAKTLYGVYDTLEDFRERAEHELVEEARRHKISRILQTCPGLGPIRVAEMIPIVVSPHRFRTRRQFWSYCGLGIVMRSSSDWVQSADGRWQRAQVNRTRGLNVRHNRQLKVIFKGAATTVINHCPNDPLHQAYQKLVTQGTKPNLAKLTLARKIAAIALAMWKTEEEYRPEKYLTKQNA